MKLYVGNLVYTMSESELHDLFSPYGKVVGARIVTDHFTRQSKNFGYVEMLCAMEGLKAKEKLHGSMVNDRNIVVKVARSRDKRHGLRW